MTANQRRYIVGVDIGGTHVTAAVIDVADERLLRPSLVRKAVDAGAAASFILDAWTGAIRDSIAAAQVPHIDGIGLAMPGPFHYERGIGAFRGVPKFHSLFGVNVQQAVLGELSLDPPPKIAFRNDAECFALGESWLGAGRGYERIVAITLGTGLGSAFIENGKAITSGPNVPESGWLYCVPFENMMAEEHFSTRGLLRRFHRPHGQELPDVAALASLARTDGGARQVFREFGARLGSFLSTFLKRFDAQCLVVGGSIAKAWDFFAEPLCEAIGSGTAVRRAELFEDAALCGAAKLALQSQEPVARSADGQWRKSGQKLMPLLKPPVEAGKYDLYPTHEIEPDAIHAGCESLAAALAGQKRVVIDGYVGVFFDDFRRLLDAALRKRGIRPIWYEMSVALKSPHQIDKLIEPFLGGDDPLFGTRFTGALRDFFESELLEAIHPDPHAGLGILIGPGAALGNWNGPLVYLDLPKNELQFRSRAGSVVNLGADAPAPSKQMYKRFYFVDWPAMNGHKRQILSRVEFIVDAQRPDEPAWMRGDAFRRALNALSTNVFRVRPWFEPGPWGGKWMKENFTDLPHDEPNYAWSFELIVPENGLILQSDSRMLEVSFDWLMFAHHERIIGESSGYFGYEFPIRFDYLDTVGGGNLSVQCHPRPEYIRRHFGERFTQDETYYIHHAEPEARVYLGFKVGIDPAEFRAALERSARDAVPVDIDRYVASWAAKKQELFLIPNGTIHCSGIGNLVLEISATPYIFTFKMYDWMRMDLDGLPRSLNIARAFDNLYFDRQGERVREEFISRPRIIESGDGWRIVHLPTHAEHFYDVRRYEFAEQLHARTDGSCHVGNLVEGSHITVRTDDVTMPIAYGETFVIPAAAERYTLINESGGESRVVIAYVKAGYLFR